MGLKVTVCNFCTFAKRIEGILVVLTGFATKYRGYGFWVFKTFVKNQQKAHFKLFDFYEKLVIIPNAIG